ncbi:MAG: radical SAM protein [Candidatus Pacearchaeota archaeon]|nr:MAG: radical SAM protein [Candidatus Pacearchaeota archaeon]
MAMGFSGSNGGISNHKKMAIGFSGSCGGVSNSHTSLSTKQNLLEELDISYFINNICNLKCRHCYVGYNNKNDELSIKEWKNVFGELIDMGALTFGNVGKEPLLSWDKTKELLYFLAEKREKISKLRFGIVTNATLMNKKIIKELAEIMPNYIDISLDGTKEKHDYIRGKGNFEKTINNIKLMHEYPRLLEKVFIIHTLNNHNKENLPEFFKTSYGFGLKNLLISPYIPTPKGNGELNISDEKIVEIYQKIANGRIFDFNKFNDLEIIIKNDYDTTKSIMDKLVEKETIDLKNLFIDEYGVIFNKYEYGTNRVIINYLPINDVFTKQIRISHDGYVSNCYAQFFENYPERKEVIGNVKEKSISEILKSFR